MPNLGWQSPAALADYFARLTISAPTEGEVAVPGLPVVIPITIADAATGDVDFTVSEKIEVVDVTCIKRNGGGVGNTVTVKNGATAITNAIACDTDNTVTRAGTVDDASSTIAIGGTLRISATRAAGTRDSLVLVHAIIRP